MSEVPKSILYVWSLIQYRLEIKINFDTWSIKLCKNRFEIEEEAHFSHFSFTILWTFIRVQSLESNPFWFVFLCSIQVWNLFSSNTDSFYGNEKIAKRMPLSEAEANSNTLQLIKGKNVLRIVISSINMINFFIVHFWIW